MSSLLNNLPECVQSEIYEFLYDRPLRKKLMKELVHRLCCIACENYLSPTFCKNGANFCSLSCYNDPKNDEIDEYMEELDYLARNGNASNYYGP